MKILHTSDIHILSPLCSTLPDEKAKIRRREILRAFRRMAEEAVRLGVRLFIVAGDLFDSDRITANAISEVISVIDNTPNITFLYLPGNHEGAALVQSGTKIPKNLLIFGNEWSGYDFDDVTVIGRSEIAPDMFCGLKLDPRRKNIAVLHGELAARSTTTRVGIKDASNINLDYIAMGHYHGYSAHTVDKRCDAVYCGSPESRGFDEAHPSGFVLIDTDTPRVSHRFVPFSLREVRIERIDISGYTGLRQIEDAVKERLADIPREDICRIVLEGRRDERLVIGCDGICQRFGADLFYLEVTDESRAFTDPATYKNDKTLKGEFIRLVLGADDLSDDDKEKIIKAGVAALFSQMDDI